MLCKTHFIRYIRSLYFFWLDLEKIHCYAFLLKLNFVLAIVTCNITF